MKKSAVEEKSGTIGQSPGDVLYPAHADLLLKILISLEIFRHQAMALIGRAFLRGNLQDIDQVVTAIRKLPMACIEP